ncbi:Uncharacterized protein BM_BM1207 [Brugia malayi]|uniref:Bm1207 n=1 Tax=Brugia malayi TaxID=6279 RepID=A0A0K0ITH4_BRUMA|nr:Uncharacterized protein BM_BM1207 [Brugia malayi]CDP92758.1 Bm1207 [Brugia malayi]VIO93114.1 Uncharacterized protein BM_BM1207 [Brugia malayi]
MNAILLALTSIWLLSLFSTLISASIICMSCATKNAVANWNKFVNYRIINPRTGRLMDDYPCDNPQNLTCNGLCYIFQISGINKVDGTKQLYAMAQGCSVGLFDGEVRCFDRPIIMLGRGGNFHLYGRYCLCNGNLCSEKTEIWIQHGQKKFYAQRQKGGSMNGKSLTNAIAISIISLMLAINGLI